MISYLKGTIIHHEPNKIILNIHGVGYLVQISTNFSSKINSGQEIELFIHTHVREDILALYGFPTLAELNFFKLLISVSGIGPKTGLEIMSTPLNLTKNALFTGDIPTLTKIPGIGKKTAERLILELKNKLELFPDLGGSQESLPFDIHPDIINALSSLGYTRYQVLNVLKNIDQKITQKEEIIRYFLKNV